MKVIAADQVTKVLSYPQLIDVLQQGYAGRYTMPPRHVFRLAENETNFDAFALLPSWNDRFIAVQAFTYFPSNPAPPYQSLYSQILLFDRAHGEPLALVDGVSVTLGRTAGISGLAARLLSRPDAKTLLLVGTGNLAPYIIRAQASVRSLTRVVVWGRTPAKAQAVVERMRGELPGIEFAVADNLERACGTADMIVAATGSHEPLVRGDWVRPGTHTDFIGNHHANKRERFSRPLPKARSAKRMWSGS